MDGRRATLGRDADDAAMSLLMERSLDCATLASVNLGQQESSSANC